MGVWRKLFNLPNAALWLRLGIRRILESAGSAITSCYVADSSCQSRAAGGITRAMTLGLLPGSGTLGYHNHETELLLSNFLKVCDEKNIYLPFPGCVLRRERRRTVRAERDHAATTSADSNPGRTCHSTFDGITRERATCARGVACGAGDTS